MTLNNPIIGDRPFVTVGQDGNSQFNGTSHIAIQLAIDYINSLGGGTVFIKKGVYTLTDNISLCDNLILIGDGRNTILKRGSSLASGVGRIDGLNTQNVTLEKFQYDGNKSNNDNSCVGIHFPSNAPKCVNIKLNDLYVHSCGESTNVEFSAGCDAYSVDGFSVSKCEFFNNAHYGITTYECSNVLISECVSHENQRHGFGSAGCNYISHENNIAYDNNGQGMWFRNNSFHNIIGNTIYYTSEQSSSVYGIQIKSGDTGGDLKQDRTNIIGNIIYGVKSTTNISYGVYIQGGLTNRIIVEGNNIDDCDYGIFMNGGTNYLITGNQISNSREVGLKDNYNSNCVYQGNFFYNNIKQSIVSYGKHIKILNNIIRSENLESDATYYGIEFYNRYYVLISGNTIDSLEGSNHYLAGIYLEGDYVHDVKVFQNYMVENIDVVVKSATYGDLASGRNIEFCNYKYNDFGVFDGKKIKISGSDSDIFDITHTGNYNCENFSTTNTGSGGSVNQVQAKQWEAKGNGGLLRGHRSVSTANRALFNMSDDVDNNATVLNLSSATTGSGKALNITMVNPERTAINTNARIVTPEVSCSPTISTGTTAPSSTPTKIGNIYINTTASDIYISKGTSNSSDWLQVN